MDAERDDAFLRARRASQSSSSTILMPIASTGFLEEVSTSINTAAAGGNASLMSIG